MVSIPATKMIIMTNYTSLGSRISKLSLIMTIKKLKPLSLRTKSIQRVVTKKLKIVI